MSSVDLGVVDGPEAVEGERTLITLQTISNSNFAEVEKNVQFANRRHLIPVLVTDAVIYSRECNGW